MNERIKELAIKAGGGPSKWYTDPDVLEYFAELIVRECMEQCAYTPNSNDEWDKGVKWASNQIAEHFGVEE